MNWTNAAHAMALQEERERVRREVSIELADWQASSEAYRLDAEQLRAEVERLTDELQEHQSRAIPELHDLRAEVERLTDAHERIVEWSRAYPLSIFPEPDLKKARALLEAGGMTLDAISAHAMRHVIEQVGKISRAALEHKP